MSWENKQIHGKSMDSELLQSKTGPMISCGTFIRLFC